MMVSPAKRNALGRPQVCAVQRANRVNQAGFLLAGGFMRRVAIDRRKRRSCRRGEPGSEGIASPRWSGLTSRRCLEVFGNQTLWLYRLERPGSAVGSTRSALGLKGRIWTGGAKFFAQMRHPAPGLVVSHRHLVGGGFADEDDLLPAAGDRGVEQVSLQHHEVALEQRDDDDRVFAALRFVDADRV